MHELDRQSVRLLPRRLFTPPLPLLAARGKGSKSSGLRAIALIEPSGFDIQSDMRETRLTARLGVPLVDVYLFLFVCCMMYCFLFV